ncbi:hypothetical protein BG000_007253 [Podila horticola]|nr:hypothetical protein BG000_007253 [Podila horticola]
MFPIANPKAVMDYVEEGDPRGEPLFLIHGFPDLWYGWRHQIKHFAKLGYRVLAVDCLGYGQTDTPKDPMEYRVRNICNQLAGVLDALNIPKVTLVQVEPKFEYQLKYANPDSTDNMNKTDREYVISEYTHSGFHGPLNYYRNTLVNFTDEIDLHKIIDLPCWIILAYDDPFLPLHLVYEMPDYMPKLKTATIWARHFAISEKPNETNELLKHQLCDFQFANGAKDQIDLK